jgi:hypothetical protein
MVISLDEDRLHELDEWRRQEPDLPSRVEAIRRLMDKGFAADAKSSKARRR